MILYLLQFRHIDIKKSQTSLRRQFHPNTLQHRTTHLGQLLGHSDWHLVGFCQSLPKSINEHKGEQQQKQQCERTTGITDNLASNGQCSTNQAQQDPEYDYHEHTAVEHDNKHKYQKGQENANGDTHNVPDAAHGSRILAVEHQRTATLFEAAIPARTATAVSASCACVLATVTAAVTAAWATALIAYLSLQLSYCFLLGADMIFGPGNSAQVAQLLFTPVTGHFLFSSGQPNFHPTFRALPIFERIFNQIRRQGILTLARMLGLKTSLAPICLVFFVDLKGMFILEILQFDRIGQISVNIAGQLDSLAALLERALHGHQFFDF